jgi:TolB-like protein
MTPEGIRRTGPTESSPAETSADSRPSIAVLPFVDMSSEKDQEYFGDGITEELLNTLARLREMRVAGRTSSFYYKGRNEDLRKIGEELGVQYILEGSVRKAGERLRITAQLINARTDSHLWSNTYDKTLDDLFQIQEDIARSVAEALQITLGVGDLGKVPGMTRNPDAYEEYLVSNVQRGVDIVMPVSPDAYHDAVHHLERAVSIDPEFSLAWVGLHYLYSMSDGVVLGGLPEAQRKSQEAMDRSLALTPESPFVLSNLSVSHSRRGRWEESHDFFLQAIAAAKKQGAEDHMRFRFGFGYHNTGHLEEAMGWYETARLVDPLNSVNAAYLSDVYMSLGETEKAFAEVDRFAKFKGHEFVLIKASGLMAALTTGDRAEILRRLDALIESEPFTFLSEFMRDHLDDREAAIAELHRVLEDPKNKAQTAFLKNIIAIWAAYFGETEFALQLIREYLLEGNMQLSFLVWRSVFKDVRQLPGFKQLLLDLGLVDYWRESGNWATLVHPIGSDDFECS